MMSVQPLEALRFLYDNGVESINAQQILADTETFDNT